MTRLYLLCLLLVVCATTAQGQVLSLPPQPETEELPIPPVEEAGKPYLYEHFTPRDYNAQQQNWAITQTPDGKIYVANLSGVLEYDGVSWRLIRTTTDAWVRSLDVASDGTVYVGSWGDIGYLAPDSTGTTHFRSLIAHVNPEDREFADVWRTLTTEEGVYFQTRTHVFFWNGQTMKVWHSEDLFRWAFVVGDTFYMREKGKGLLTRVGDELQLVSGGAAFAGEVIYMMEPYDEEAILIGTWEGFYIYRNNEVRPFVTELDDLLPTLDVYAGTTVGDDFFAITTLGQGVIILNRDGKVVHVLDQEEGFPDSMVNHAFEDQQGGLWLALNGHGILRVDVPSQLSYYEHQLGLEGSVRDMIRFEGSFYVATGSGLFVLEHQPIMPNRERRTRFMRIPDVPQTWSFSVIENQLYVTSEGGIYRIQGNQVRRVSDKAGFVLVALQGTPHQRYLGTYDGLEIVNAEGPAWVSERAAVDVNQVRSIIEEADGTLWMGSIDGTVTRVENLFSEHLNIQSYGEENGLPAHPAFLEKIKDDLVVSTRAGIYRYVAGNEASNQFVLDPTLVPPASSAADSILAFEPDAAGDLWVARPDGVHIGRLQADGSYDFESPPALQFDLHLFPQIYVEPDGVAWIGHGNELIRYDAHIEKTYNAPYQAAIREVVDMRSRRTMYGGMGAAAASRLSSEGIAYDDNTLEFQYAAPTYNRPEETQYQYFLEGKDEDWSGWTAQTSKTYPSLREGNYRFRVRAVNGQGIYGEEAVLNFRILPPWYRTWWAFSLYFVMLISALVLGHRYQVAVTESRKAQEHAEELARERMVNERLQEVNLRLQEANESLLQANRLKDEFLANTSHELRTPLTAILGFTSIMRDEAEGQHREFLDLISSNGERLLTTVNSLLDLARIRAGMITLSNEVTNVNTQVVNVVRLLSPLAKQKNLIFTLTVKDDPLYARLDPHYLDRILYNIIGNAIKFTEEGRVEVEVGLEDAMVVVQVLDTGVGISEAFMPELFVEFQQESTGFGRSHEGSGLGLAITSHLVNLMGGEIDVESTKGAGSIFTVRLPQNYGESVEEEVGMTA